MALGGAGQTHFEFASDSRKRCWSSTACSLTSTDGFRFSLSPGRASQHPRLSPSAASSPACAHSITFAAARSDSERERAESQSDSTKRGAAQLAKINLRPSSSSGSAHAFGSAFDDNFKPQPSFVRRFDLDGSAEDDCDVGSAAPAACSSKLTSRPLASAKPQPSFVRRFDLDGSAEDDCDVGSAAPAACSSKLTSRPLASAASRRDDSTAIDPSAGSGNGGRREKEGGDGKQPPDTCIDLTASDNEEGEIKDQCSSDAKSGPAPLLWQQLCRQRKDDEVVFVDEEFGARKSLRRADKAKQQELADKALAQKLQDEERRAASVEQGQSTDAGEAAFHHAPKNSATSAAGGSGGGKQAKAGGKGKVKIHKPTAKSEKASLFPLLFSNPSSPPPLPTTLNQALSPSRALPKALILTPQMHRLSFSHALSPEK